MCRLTGECKTCPMLLAIESGTPLKKGIGVSEESRIKQRKKKFKTSSSRDAGILITCSCCQRLPSPGSQHRLGSDT